MITRVTKAIIPKHTDSVKPTKLKKDTLLYKINAECLLSPCDVHFLYTSKKKTTRRYMVIQQLTGPSLIKHNELTQLPKHTNVCSHCPKKHNLVYLNESNYKIILY